MEEIVEAPLVAEAEPEPAWEGEPATGEELLDQYVVENKFAASIPGVVMYMVKATTRAGEEVNLTSGQTHKLYMATCMLSTCGEVE